MLKAKLPRLYTAGSSSGPGSSNKPASTYKSLITLCLLFVLIGTNVNAQDCSVNAGVGYAICPGNFFTLDGNATGLYYDTSVIWTVDSIPSGASVSFVNPRQLNTNTSAVTVPGPYRFKLSTRCTDGTVTSQKVIFTVNTTPSSSPTLNFTAVPNPFCVKAGTQVVFSGNTAPPAGATEEWSYTSSRFSGSFSSTSVTNPTFTFNGLDSFICPSNGNITFRRTFRTVSGCTQVTTVTLNPFSQYNIDIQTNLCGGVSLKGVCSGNGTGTWSVVSSTASATPVFSTTTGQNTAITNPESGASYTIRYTVSGASCINGSKDVTFVYSAGSSVSGTVPNAGPDQVFTTSLPSAVTLNGNAPNASIGETGTWSQVAGPAATITNPSNPATTVTGLIEGNAYIFRWRITQSTGCGNFDDMIVKGPIDLPFTQGTDNCYSLFFGNPPRNTLGRLFPFVYGSIDSVRFKITMISQPASLGTVNTPIQLALLGGTSCGGGSGCVVVTNAIGTSKPVATFTAMPGTTLSSADIAATDLEYRISYYPKAPGAYTFGYEYAVNGGAVHTGSFTINVGLIATVNAGTDQVLNCTMSTTTLAGSALSFTNTTDPSDPLTYGPVYNGEWITVTKPAGATDPFTTANKYRRNPTLTGLIPGKYTFRLAPAYSAVTGCGTDDFVDVFVTNTAPASVPMPAAKTVCKGADVDLSVIETGYYPKGWELVSGPSVPVFVPSAQTRNVTVKNLLAGIYTFRFTDSSRCGNASGTVMVTVSSTDSISQARFDSCRVDYTAHQYFVAAGQPKYANGETARFYRLVKGVETAINAAPDPKTIASNGTFTSGGSTDTSVRISGFSATTSTSDGIVLVYEISRSGCGVTRDTIVLTEYDGSLTDGLLPRNYSLCNTSLPYTNKPYALTDIPTSGNGPSNNEWLGELYAQWSVVTQPEGAIAPTFSAQGDINSNVTFNTPGVYLLRVRFPELTAGNTFCAASGVYTDANNYIYLSYRIGAPTTVLAKAGSNQVLCAPASVASLSATPTRGFWSVVGFNNSGAPVLGNDTMNNTTLSFTLPGDARLQWLPRPEYEWCAATNFDVVNVSYIASAQILGGKIRNLCSVPDSFAVSVNAAGSDSVTRSFTRISGPGSPVITAPSKEQYIIKSLSTGTHKFKYTFTSAACGTSNDTLTLNIGSCFSVSGYLWNDINGNAVNDGETRTNVNNSMWVYLTDNNGVIIEKVKMDGTGFYSFSGMVNGLSYKIVLGQASSGEPGSTLFSAQLPSGWVSTGVSRSGVADITNQNGIINLGTISASLSNQNFGIEQPPFAKRDTLSSRSNPGGTGNIDITNYFAGTDSVTNKISSITIPVFPDSITSLRVGTTTYYPNSGAIPIICPTAMCSVFPSGGGLNIPTDTTGKPTSTVSFDPVDGSFNVVVSYLTVDEAGKSSASSGSVTTPLSATLPIYLLTFDVSRKDDCSNMISWSTAKESDVKSYAIIRSLDGIDYVLIREVQAQGKSANSYSFTDVFEGTALYRLNVYLLDGTIAHSDTKKMTACGKSGSSIYVYPNPVGEKLHYYTADQVSTVSIYNVLGEKVKVLSANEMAEQHADVNMLVNGTYLLVIRKTNGEQISIPFLKKM